jgi:hypothetical protein
MQLDGDVASPTASTALLDARTPTQLIIAPPAVRITGLFLCRPSILQNYVKNIPAAPKSMARQVQLWLSQTSTFYNASLGGKTRQVI